MRLATESRAANISPPQLIPETPSLGHCIGFHGLMPTLNVFPCYYRKKDLQVGILLVVPASRHDSPLWYRCGNGISRPHPGCAMYHRLQICQVNVQHSSFIGYVGNRKKLRCATESSKCHRHRRAKDHSSTTYEAKTLIGFYPAHFWDSYALFPQ
jgi:hypothetical protein